jgi:putative inorganic carbon (hco3(-)) transporter
MGALGLASAMVLSGIAPSAASRAGDLLAMAAMGLFLWFKSRHKFVIGIYMVIAVGPSWRGDAAGMV